VGTGALACAAERQLGKVGISHSVCRRQKYCAELRSAAQPRAAGPTQADFMGASPQLPVEGLTWARAPPPGWGTINHVGTGAPACAGERQLGKVGISHSVCRRQKYCAELRSAAQPRAAGPTQADFVGSSPLCYWTHTLP